MKHKLNTGSKTQVSTSPIAMGILYLCGAATVMTVKSIVYYGTQAVNKINQVINGK